MLSVVLQISLVKNDLSLCAHSLFFDTVSITYWNFYGILMSKPSPISIFAAATTLLVSATSVSPSYSQVDGGLKEWTTDQAIDAESTMDDDAAALKKKAESEDVCVPIGEGENCW